MQLFENKLYYAFVLNTNKIVKRLLKADVKTESKDSD